MGRAHLFAPPPPSVSQSLAATTTIAKSQPLLAKAISLSHPPRRGALATPSQLPQACNQAQPALNLGVS